MQVNEGEVGAWFSGQHQGTWGRYRTTVDSLDLMIQCYFGGVSTPQLDGLKSEIRQLSPDTDVTGVASPTTLLFVLAELNSLGLD